MIAWSISSLKIHAKEALNRNYWPCVAVGLISVLISNGGGCRGSGSLDAKDIDELRDAFHLGRTAVQSEPGAGLAASALAEVAEKLDGENPELAGRLSEIAAQLGTGSESGPGDGPELDEGGGSVPDADAADAGGGDGEIPGGDAVKDASDPDMPARMAIYSVVGLVLFHFTAAIVIVFQFFVFGPLEVGITRFFLRASRGKSEWGDLGWGFGKTRYWTVARTMFLRNLMIGLWTLVFVVPGIVKAYSWRLVPMILADDKPTGDSSLAIMRRSRDLTFGHKWHMVGFDLSFVGWFVLGVFSCGIVLVFFVTPWKSLANVGLYDTLNADS